MSASQLYIESRKMPMVRLLMALIAGILLQWYLVISFSVLCVVFFIAFGSYLLFALLPTYTRFRLPWVQGLLVLLIIASGGSFLSYSKNPLHQKNNVASVYRTGDAVLATVNEGLLSKAKTYKANATVTAIYRNKKYLPVTGTIIIYFNKENIDARLQYGSQILFTDSLQSIINTGNPGALDYRRFLLFQGVTAQVFLKSNHYLILAGNRGSSFYAFILNLQKNILQTLQTYIPRSKEQGVAEALLIGYRNDLDKQLVQSYTNTGVVHIIAISGLHLGMIYGFIVLLFSPFKSKKWYRFAMPITALFILWMFTLLAGAVPSILRSAVTFSFIALGVIINRKGSIYNTLAASAICLLIANPYFLWDVGFQLSYAAVAGISLFTRPISNTIYFENKLLRKIWSATCVTLAAQILTLPIILYAFHQFPIWFLITNLLVVFLSEIILFAMLFLLAISKWVWLSVIAGRLVQSMLWLMNTIIERAEKLPFSLLTNIKTDVLQAWLIYGIIVLLAVWRLYKMPRLLMYGFALFLILQIYTFVQIWQANQQHKLIVYNINKHELIDVVTRRNAVSFCDDSVLNDVVTNSFYIKPCRTFFGINQCSNKRLPANANLLLRVNGKTILLLSKPLPAVHSNRKIKADIVVVANNAKLYMDDLFSRIDCTLIIADNNTSFYKINKWKNDCDRLRIRFYSIAQQGAFVADL